MKRLLILTALFVAVFAKKTFDGWVEILVVSTKSFFEWKQYNNMKIKMVEIMLCVAYISLPKYQNYLFTF